MEKVIPNFFIVGAAKSGTTFLYHYLKQHPDIFMSNPKEPFFFEAEFEKGLDFYRQKYFQSYKGERIIGEARHRNLYLPYVPQRIKELSPEAKIIIILRNPIERAYSHWWHWYSRKEENLSFEEALYEDLKRIKKGILFFGEEGEKLWKKNFDFKTGKNEYRTYLDSGYYAEQIKRYFNLFPKENIKIIFSDDLFKEPQKILEDVFQFLEVKTISFSNFSPKNISYSRGKRIIKKFYKIGKKTGATFFYHFLPQNFRKKIRKKIEGVGTAPAMNKITYLWLKEHYKPFNNDLENILNKKLKWKNE